MKFKPTTPAADRAGFTLAEVLAALLFMAIVIPVAIEGVRIAARAGDMGARKAVATRLAENVLNEQTLQSQSQSTSQGGTIEQGGIPYSWTVRSEPWSVDSLTLTTVQVDFPVQGQLHNVQLSTLVDGTATTNTTTTASQ